jgi:serine/threonine protein kinase
LYFVNKLLKYYLYIYRPELILGEGYSFNSDVWSAGCVLYELISLEKAFKGGNQFLIIKSIIEHIPPELNDSIFSSVLSRFIFLTYI